DPRDLAAVQEVLIDRVARLALRIEAAVDLLEVGPGVDLGGDPHGPAREVVDEPGRSGGDRGDHRLTARDLLDVDAGVADLDGHVASSLFRSPPRSGRRLAGEQLELQDDELGRLDRSDADDHVTEDRKSTRLN